MTPTAINQDRGSEAPRAGPRHSVGEQTHEAPTFSSEHPNTVRDIRQVAADKYAERCEIDQIFGLVGFAVSPCWDIMLHFYIEDANAGPIQGPDICIGDARPPSTCVRWLRVLVNMGLLEQLSAMQDGVEGFYGMTPDGRAKIEAVLKLSL